VYGDSAYDTASFYQTVLNRGGAVIVSPRLKAMYKENPPLCLEGRNTAVLEILGLEEGLEGRHLWKKT
jgi:hypothetical protein